MLFFRIFGGSSERGSVPLASQLTLRIPPSWPFASRERCSGIRILRSDPPPRVNRTASIPRGSANKHTSGKIPGGSFSQPPRFSSRRGRRDRRRDNAGTRPAAMSPASRNSSRKSTAATSLLRRSALSWNSPLCGILAEHLDAILANGLQREVKEALFRRKLSRCDREAKTRSSQWIEVSESKPCFKKRTSSVEKKVTDGEGRQGSKEGRTEGRKEGRGRVRNPRYPRSYRFCTPAASVARLPKDHSELLIPCRSNLNALRKGTRLASKPSPGSRVEQLPNGSHDL